MKSIFWRRSTTTYKSAEVYHGESVYNHPIIINTTAEVKFSIHWGM